MAAMTDTEMSIIAKLQREEGIRRLSSHFSWLEFSGDEVRQIAHQQFVYDSAMFASHRGLAWSAVKSVAGMTKDLFPKLADLDPPGMLCLISACLTKCFPHLPPTHHNAVFQFLSDTCVTRQRLLQNLIVGNSHLSISQKHLDVQVPPTPLPLAQGCDEGLQMRHTECARLQVAEQQKREELQRLREEEEGPHWSEVTLDTPQDCKVDREEVAALVRSAVWASGGILMKESSLMYDLLKLSLQHTALTTGESPTHKL